MGSRPSSAVPRRRPHQEQDRRKRGVVPVAAARVAAPDELTARVAAPGYFKGLGKTPPPPVVPPVAPPGSHMLGAEKDKAASSRSVNFGAPEGGKAEVLGARAGRREGPARASSSRRSLVPDFSLKCPKSAETPEVNLKR